MSDPLVSVMIPTWNRATFIPTAIRSIQRQSYENWEIVVVDDGSTDNTKQVIAAMNDSRIKYFYMKHLNMWASRNRALSESQGEVIAKVDDDDYVREDYLAELVRILRDADSPKTISHCQFSWVINGVVSKQGYVKMIPDKYVMHRISGQVCCATATTWRESYNDVGPYNPYSIGEDTEWNIRALLKEYTFIESPEYMYFYVRHQNQSVVLRPDITLDIFNKYRPLWMEKQRCS